MPSKGRVRSRKTIDMHNGESARLPPMCHGFDSRTRRHMWVEFVVGSLLCSERFFSGYSGFSPLLKNQHFPIPIRSLNARTFLNEFLWTPWCFVGKQITFFLHSSRVSRWTGQAGWNIATPHTFFFSSLNNANIMENTSIASEDGEKTSCPPL